MIKKVFRIFSFSTSAVIQTAIFAAAIVIIFAVSYILGHRYLDANVLMGNDSYSYFAVVKWFSDFFPKIPYWFPQQGAGISVFAGYPYAPAFLIILLSRLSSFDLVQAYKLLGFLSVPITAIGVFVFCWSRMTDVKPVWMRQVLGIFASLFYITSPLAWVWLTKWGFYSESISHMFVPWTIIFFDYYLDYLFENKNNLWRRMFFVLTVVSLVITTWVHIFSGVSILPIFFILGLYRFIFSKEKKLALLKRIALPTAALGAAFICLFAFRYWEFTYYYKNVADGGFRGYKSLKDAEYQELANNMLTLRMTLSLDEPLFDATNPDPTDSYRSTIREVRYPYFVWILAVPTLIFGLFRSKKMFALGLYALFGLYTSTSPEFMMLLGDMGPLAALSNVLKGRIYFIPMRLVMPAVAVYGAYVFWDLIGQIISWLTNKITKYAKYLIYPVRVTVVLCLTVATIVMAVYKYYNLPYERSKANIGADNPVDLRDIWAKQGAKEREQIAPKEIFNNTSGYKIVLEQLKLKNWPEFKVAKDIGTEIDGARTFFDPLPKDQYRFDISGYSGRQVMIAPLVSPNSQIQMYINTLSLIYDMWNYQTQTMYAQYPVYQKPGVLTEIAKWFGLKYIYLTGSDLEPGDYWKTDPNWEQITDKWWKFNQPNDLYEVNKKPKILIISDDVRGFYTQTFRFFNRGALLYDEGIPVRGEKTVDSYSLKELQKYDAIFMRGYDYKLKFRAYNLLDKYVAQGGKLIFDTGWQYNIPDWEIDRAPAFMPFDGLTWKKLSTNSVFKIDDPITAGDVDSALFGPLTWEDTSWGVSVPTKIRPWAKTVVSYDGNPLVVKGNYGKGSVVWIGFNIIPHSEAKDSLEEVKFLGNLIDSLVNTKQSDTYKVARTDQGPDKVVFTIADNVPAGANLFFKETFNSYWKAYVVTGKTSRKTPILRAGPGFRLVSLPAMKSGDRVVFKIVPPWNKILANTISVITTMILILYIIYPKLITKLVTRINSYKAGFVEQTVKNRLNKIKKTLQDDQENY